MEVEAPRFQDSRHK